MKSRNLTWIVFAGAVAAVIVLSTILGRERGVSRSWTELPEGTVLVASLDQPLSSASTRSGDPFVASVVAPVVFDGKTVLPSGTEIRGRVEEVSSGAGGSEEASMTLVFQSVVDAKGEVLPLQAEPIRLVGATGAEGSSEMPLTPGEEPLPAVGPGGEAITIATVGTEIELRAGQQLAIELAQPARLALAALGLE
jgi:hypothetical protein